MTCTIESWWEGLSWVEALLILLIVFLHYVLIILISAGTRIVHEGNVVPKRRRK